uniref:Uncharacterized protein n=1 Tax=Cajanus cajan TaxID=3821 RepID=A0A151SYK5_CAJCA|nr:hypothetical protein KK1_015321 [Cajanus cajan]
MNGPTNITTNVNSIPQDTTKSAHITPTLKYKGKGLKKKKDKEVAVIAPRKQQKKSNESEGNDCFFCGTIRHVKKHFTHGMLRKVCFSTWFVMKLF